MIISYYFEADVQHHCGYVYGLAPLCVRMEQVVKMVSRNLVYEKQDFIKQAFYKIQAGTRPFIILSGTRPCKIGLETIVVQDHCRLS